MRPPSGTVIHVGKSWIERIRDAMEQKTICRWTCTECGIDLGADLRGHLKSRHRIAVPGKIRKKLVVEIDGKACDWRAWISEWIIDGLKFYQRFVVMKA